MYLVRDSRFNWNFENLSSSAHLLRLQYNIRREATSASLFFYVKQLLQYITLVSCRVLWTPILQDCVRQEFDGLFVLCRPLIMTTCSNVLILHIFSSRC